MRGLWAYVCVNYTARSARVVHDEQQAREAARAPATCVIAIPMQLGRVHLVSPNPEPPVLEITTE